MHIIDESKVPSGTKRLIIGSRGSDLALYQANLIASLLGKLGIFSEIKIIKTAGDKIDNLSFDKMEGKNFFTKELEDALLTREIDMAVHSLKDLSTQMPDGLKVGAYCSPEDPSELLLIRPEFYDPNQKLFVKSGAIIGTSSARRQAQIAYFGPDLKIEPLRGNVPTRVKKLREGKYDAILIARAGVYRLGLDLSGLQVHTLDRFEFIPAPGQGILTIEIRDNDTEVEKAVSQLNDRTAEETAKLERGLLARFQGGCQLPLAVTSEKRGNRFYLKAFLGVREGEGWGKPAFFEGEAKNGENLIESAHLSLQAVSSDITHKKKVLITRSEPEAAHIFKNLSEKIEIIYYPDFTIVASYNKNEANEAISRLNDFDWMIFTSKNSVRVLFDILHEHKVVLPTETKVAAIGQKSAELLKLLGIKEVFVPDREDSTGLIDELPARLGSSHLSILLPQGEEAPMTLEKGLKALGHEIIRINIYKTIPTPKRNLPEINIGGIDFFIFTSPLSVTYFKELGNKLPDKAWVASIGRPTAESLIKHYRAPDFIPDKADLSAIVNKISERI